MTKLLITSDIHTLWEKALKLLKKEQFDISINLGDSEMPEELIKKHFDHYVGGNCDYNYSVEEKTIEVEGITLALCHGHTRGIYVQDTYQEAIEFGKDMNASIVLHGHSHKLRHVKGEGIDVICPGSINRPRTDFGPSYAILTLDKGEIKNLEFKSI